MMFNRLLWLLFAGVSCTAFATPKYAFSRYPSGKIYQGKRAPVKIPKRWLNLVNDEIKAIYNNPKYNKIGFASYIMLLLHGDAAHNANGAD